MNKLNVRYINTCPVKCTIDYCEFDVNPLNWSTPEEREVWFVMSHKKYDVPNELDIDFNDYDSWEELVSKNIKEGQVYKFVNWYEHSGISLNLQDSAVAHNNFDSGIVGVIIANDINDLNAEFAYYKAYIEGNVYEYILEDMEGNVFDSCSGYYGINDIKAELKEYENITYTGIEF